MTALEIIFLIITLFMVAGLIIISSFHKKVFILTAIWLTFIGFLSYHNFFKETNSLPPRFLLVIIPSIIWVVLTFKWINFKTIRLEWLIAIHIIRIPVELVLHRLYTDNLIPKLMTYEGWNFDIISGISATLIFLIMIVRKKPLSIIFLKIWNWCALMLLTIIVGSALLSAPTPIQLLALDQPNIAVLQFPFTWLPAFVVPVVLLSHLLIFKKLNYKK